METTYQCSHQINKVLNPNKKEKRKEPEPQPPKGNRNYYQRKKAERQLQNNLSV